MRQRLSTKGIGIRIDDKAKKYLIENGYDAKNGARPLRREIEDEVESLLSEQIIAGELVKGDIPTLKLVGKKLKLVNEPKGKKTSEVRNDQEANEHAKNVLIANKGKITKEAK